MIGTVLLVLIAVFTTASTGAPVVADSAVHVSKADTAKAAKSSDTLVKKKGVSKKSDSAVKKKTSKTSSIKVSSAKTTEKKSIPVKKQKKVKVKKRGSIDLSKMFIAISKKIPSTLNLPDHMFKSIVGFVKKNTFKVVLLLSFLTIIVSTLLFYRQRVDGKRFMTTTRLSVMDKEVQRACRFIENSFDDVSLSVEKICDEMVTGKAFLAALFERELGMTVEGFIAQVRINRAKIFIKKELSADNAAVATKTGFSDANQFINTFEKLCGVSVDEYRKSVSANKNF
ncbi:MAG: helix-turn-helix transcriptional regulator [Chitinispirillaceae bacterium]|nr:helix-turn-helix transcriptional regulator [Chitinispirillaceae bacterium]